MWQTGVVGIESPWPLVRAVFLIVGLHFSLRGGQEHRDLVVEQFRRFPTNGSYTKESYYEYVERGSKNYQGRFADIDSNKVTRVYAQPGSTRCPVLILDLYLSKLPCNPTAFYMQPLPKVPTDPLHPWFQRSPIGVNPLKNMMPNISRLSGIHTRYTNHSLRATAATRMFAAGVPEKIIADRTGHKSAKALRQYERTSDAQLQAAGLAVSEQKPFSLESTDRKPLMALENTAVKEEEEAVEKKHNPACIDEKLKRILPTFTGSMSNCTININM